VRPKWPSRAGFDPDFSVSEFECGTFGSIQTAEEVHKRAAAGHPQIPCMIQTSPASRTNHASATTANSRVEGRFRPYSVEKPRAKTALATSISAGFSAFSTLLEVIGSVAASDRPIQESGPDPSES